MNCNTTHYRANSSSVPGDPTFLVAGQLLHLQSTLVGETAQKSLEFWNYDVAFLSAEAMDERGLWNSQASIVEQQKIVLQRSARAVFCIDGSKLKRPAPHFLIPWERVEILLTDAPAAKLQRAGIHLTERQRATFVTETGLPGEATVNSVPPDDLSGGEEMPVHIL